MTERWTRVYDPTAEPKVASVRLAPRLDSLAGARVGILDNGKPNADILMLSVAKRLQELHGIREVLKREKPIAGPPPPDVLADLMTCDFVIVGSAD